MSDSTGELHGMALFAGIGGLELGIELAAEYFGVGFRSLCYVEREAYSAAALVARMEDATLAPACIWDDVTTLDPEPWAGNVDLISAGFPCQPFSSAGKKLGQEDERWLWDDIVRILRVVRPRWIVLENVPGLVRLGLGPVLRDLAVLGYDAEWGRFTAAEVGATHKRARIFIVARRRSVAQDADGVGRRGRDDGGAPGSGRETEAAGLRGAVAAVGDGHPQRGHSLDDPNSGRHGEPNEEVRAGRDAAVDAGGCVADADGEQRGPAQEQPDAWDDGWDNTRRRGEKLADAARGESGKSSARDRRSRSERGSDALADAARTRRGSERESESVEGSTGSKGRSRDQSSSAAEHYGSDVADAARARCDGSEDAGDDSRDDGARNPLLESERSRSVVAGDGIPLFPPNPDDLRSWVDVLGRELFLCPALPRPEDYETQSDVLRMADGLAVRMEYRENRIRSLGNGVHPLEAAYAIATLCADAGWKLSDV